MHSVFCHQSPSLPAVRPCTSLSLGTLPRLPELKRESPSLRPRSHHALALLSLSGRHPLLYLIERHPVKYASMLADKMLHHKADAYLVNTGWSGGAYGTGKRISLKHTRAIIDAIHSGELSKATYENYDKFNFAIPTSCTGVPPYFTIINIRAVMSWIQRRAGRTETRLERP
jgi:hypothetical protein